MRRRNAAVLFTALTVASLPGVAQSAATITGTVTRLANGSAIEGAVVTVAGPHQRPVTARTGTDGKFSVNAPDDGPYSLSVHATGFAGQSFAGVPPEPIALAPATFTPLPVHAGSARSIAADATSGIFYAAMEAAPELYRTLDYGGSWQPVTMRYDDPDTGLHRPGGGLFPVVTSSVPGEVAVATVGRSTGANGAVVHGHLVHFSRDYGITWRTISGFLENPSGPPSNPTFLFWGHAGAQNAIVVAKSDANGNRTVWRADMAAPEPAFRREAADPFGQGSVVAGAHSASGPFIGRVNASGELSFAPLTAANPLVFGAAEASGLATPPALLRLGGVPEASAPPRGAFVVGGTFPAWSATMLTKGPSGPFEASQATSVPSTCRFGPSWVVGAASVAPTTTGTTGWGSVGRCWVTKSGPGALTFSETAGEDGLRDFVYDAGWGAGNHVVLKGSAEGPLRSVRPDPGVPDFQLAVQGIVSPTVADTAYGPGANQLAVAVTDGRLSLASESGGESFASVVDRGWGSTQVRWWQGQSGRWLVFGHGSEAQRLLSASLNWDGSSSVGSPNVDGSRPSDLGGPFSSLRALHELPGTDRVFLGVFDPRAFFPDPPTSDPGTHLYRARLVPGAPPSLAEIFSFDSALGGVILFPPQAFAYCPSISGAADVLFVATGESVDLGRASANRGSLLRITGASSGSPAVTEVASIPHGTERTSLFDVRAHCASGVVYAGGENHGTLYRSTNGGATFSAITLTGPGGVAMDTIGPITAIGLNPSDPNDVKVAAGPGLVTHSSDGGATWTVVNDPVEHRPMPVRDIEFAPGGGGFAQTTSRLALLGTGSGAFRGDVSVSAGVIGLTPPPRGSKPARGQITTVASDSHPVAVAHGNGGSSAVFRRSNGLYHAGASPRAGWSVATLIPRTAGGAFPAAARDRAGRLHVAYARRGRPAGIYVATRAANGTWAPPRRVSNRVGDTLPALAVTGRNSVAIVFLRTRGAKGVYHVASRAGRWGKAHRVRGTGAADASPALGGPSLAARTGRLHLTFARAGRRRGIVYASAAGSRWRAATRLTKAPAAQPTIAISPTGARQIVFRARGLFALRGGKRWSRTRIPGTTRTDTEPSLAASGTGFTLVFARLTGRAVGIYISTTAAIGGRWAKPRRLTANARDRNPSLSSDSVARDTIVFERA